MKYVSIFLFLMGFWYLASPVASLSEFPTLPASQKFQDMPSRQAYYSNNWRPFVTAFYFSNFAAENCKYFALNLLCYLKPLKINHSTGLASTYFTPLQKSTYLEEYFYPLKDAILVNGYEPYDASGKPFDQFSQPLLHKNSHYVSRINLRYTASPIFSRLTIYILIWIIIIWEIKVFRNLKKKG